MTACQDARNAIAIRELTCPHCGKTMECFIRDGFHAVEARCESCGFSIPEGTPFGEEICD